ncbi:MAG: DNA double-strand break repair nuclease NurA [Nitrososphaerales archaeon]
MLHDIYLDAIKNRKEKLASVSMNLNKTILESAQEMWREYRPLSKECTLLGVDSSYNKKPFQGFHLYVIDAVCVRGDGNIVAKKYESGIRVIDQRQLEVKSMQMEAEAAAEAADTSDLALIDGSMISRFVLGSGSAIKSAVDLTNEHSNIIFISKTSDSREIFDHMNSKVSNKPGYSKPHYVTRYRDKFRKRVTVVFARLADYTPLVKLEFPQEVDESAVKRILDHIAFGSISGYPYVLKVAHNAAVITDDDIQRLVSIYGLKNEIGAREVLR